MTDTSVLAGEARRCTSSPVGLTHIESFTDPDAKKYKVWIDPNGLHTCTCMAFVMAKNRAGGNSAIGTVTCKHIDYLARNGCGWNSETGEVSEIPTICPRCYAYTETYSTADPRKVDLDVLLAAFEDLKSRAKRRRRQ